MCINRIQENCLVYEAVFNYSPSTVREVKCEYCNDQYYLRNDNNCQRMIANCQSTDESTGRCTVCI